MSNVELDHNKSLRCRAWCFTWNNPPDDAEERLKGVTCTRMVVGREVGASGTPHLQGYVRFAQPQRFSWWKIHFPNLHVETRKGTETQAAEYCKKDGVVLIDRGVNCDEKVDTQGLSRNEEADMVMDEIDHGAKLGHIYNRHKRFCFWNYRNVENWYYRQQHFNAEGLETDPENPYKKGL